MNKEELKVLYKFFDARLKTKMLGSSDYSPLIYLINENERIVEDLDNNAINFLDSAISRNYILAKINNNNRYDAIVKLLQVLNRLDKEYERKNITMNVFLKEFDKEVIRFNKENNYEYEIIHDGNLLDSENLLEYIRNGYVIQESWSAPLKLKHKDLIRQDKEEWDRFQQEHYGKKEGK